MQGEREYEVHEFKDRKSIYDDVVSPGISDRHGGYITLDGIVKTQTVQCPHCQKHFPVRRGSGQVRGWCQHCMRVTCGKESCHPCVPWEQKMLQIEAAERRRKEVDGWLSGGQ